MCASLRVVTKRELESVEICNSTKAAYGTQKLAVTDTGQSPAGLFIARGLPQAHGSYCLSCSSVNRSVAQCRRQSPHLAFALRDLTQTVVCTRQYLSARSLNITNRSPAIFLNRMTGFPTCLRRT